MKNLSDFREEYRKGELHESEMLADPLEQFKVWMDDAINSHLSEPNAMAVATSTPDGKPSIRVVLLKEVNERGFVFYTNYTSAKAGEIEAAGKAAFVLHWKSLRRQIRVRGLVSREEGPLADEYYASRSLKSRLGAWASRQSQPLSSRAHLMAEVAKVTALKGPNPPRPPFWGGYRIRPLEIEFWADGAFRLHDRFRWRRSDLSSAWKIDRLNP